MYNGNLDIVYTIYLLRVHAHYIKNTVTFVAKYADCFTNCLTQNILGLVSIVINNLIAYMFNLR